jgi:chemotaxis protein CheX
MMTLLTNESIADLTQQIWDALLPDDGAPLLPGDLPGGEVVAVAEISGEWNGVVCLSCSPRAARHAAAAMFEMADEELTADEITDAVGELVNVVGGNIKSLVPGPTVLSLPQVSEGGMTVLPDHLEQAFEVRFSWMAEPVIVSIWTEAE